MFLLVFLITLLFISNAENVIVDSNISFEKAIAGTKAPEEILDQLCILDVNYISKDLKIHKGQLIINKSVKQDIKDIFELMLDKKFIVEKVIPIVEYGWSDSASMDDNNTSAFNYRVVAGTNNMSNHAYGRAVDINPFFNPVIHKDGTKAPKKAKYDKSRNGTFFDGQFIVDEFVRRGWRWGGKFSKYQDNHHFDKLDK